MTTDALLVLGSLNLHLTILLYADPGSGMLMWQLATASLLSALFYAKTILRKIRVLIRPRQPEKGHEPPISHT